MITPITVPYVTPASFKAYPTFLDYGLLNTGSTLAADQDAELLNVLLKASAWASFTICNQPLHAHSITQNMRLRASSDGLLKWHPSDNPVRLITAFSYGYSPGVPNLRAVTDLSQQWIEEDSQVVMPFGPLGPGFSSIQFSPPSPSNELYTQWTYLAGYSNSTLASIANSGTASVTPRDVTGILAGDVLRIWEPGKEEAVQVGPGYVTGAAVVPLTANLAITHAAGAGISAMPPDVLQAVVNYTVALLMRPDSTAEDQFPDNAPSTGTRGRDARKSSGGLIAEATRLLSNYARVR